MLEAMGYLRPSASGDRVRTVRDAFVGFDSAWADKNPGAVCGATFDDGRLVAHLLPECAHFDDGREVVERCSEGASYTLVAIDQPTMVPNATGMRAVERVARNVKKYVLPAYLNGPLFGRSAPIWEFLDTLDPSEDPRKAQLARLGLHLIEVFPGLALPGLLASPPSSLPIAIRYDPTRSSFAIEDWRLVAKTVSAHAQTLDLDPFADWAEQQATNPKPTKADQDCLDAVICLIVALKWRRRQPDTEVLGDWRGHMVTPLSAEGKKKIMAKACSDDLDVPVGGGSWKLHEVVLGYFDGKHYDAFEWLAAPNAAFGGESPMERAKTPVGLQDVIDLIGRLVHGIPS